MTLIAFLDVEASGLGPGSYPIEIGVALVDTDTRRRGPAMSWLIRPAEDWAADWDPLAEDLHGIARETLERDGLTGWTVVERLTAAMAGVSTVYSDAPDRDDGWLEMLFEQSPLPCTIGLREYNGLLLSEIGSFGRERAQAVLREARAAAAREHPVQHRALPDVLHLRETFLLLARAARGEGDGG